MMIAGLIIILVLLSIVATILLVRNRSQPKTELPRGTSREYTLTEVKLQNIVSSCWVTFGGQVFDVTNFVAGLEPTEAIEFTKLCGTNLETLPTSIKTAEKLSKYQIGILVP
jgi:hypothetical protein